MRNPFNPQWTHLWSCQEKYVMQCSPAKFDSGHFPKTSPVLHLKLVFSCRHFQVPDGLKRFRFRVAWPRSFPNALLLRSHQQIVLSNSRLSPWKYKRLQTTLRLSEPTARHYVNCLRKGNRAPLDVGCKWTELNILPSDSLVNQW